MVSLEAIVQVMTVATIILLLADVFIPRKTITKILINILETIFMLSLAALNALREETALVSLWLILGLTNVAVIIYQKVKEKIKEKRSKK